jgi:4-diphosphocytidyl-2C-methyl-D-erythritol kinase
VYAAYDTLGPRPLRETQVRAAAQHAWIDPAVLFNDLTAAAESVEPRLGALRRDIAGAARQPVHMTGSGSGLFITCADDAEARRTAAAITPVAKDCTILRPRLM